MIQKITFGESYELCQILCRQTDYALGLSPNKRIVQVFQEDTKILEFKLPLLFPKIAEEQNLSIFLSSLPPILPDYLILLIQAGNAALGQFEEGNILNHKVIRKYMIRAKQGKAQIGHLKTKGKSKAGSRVRLAQTRIFFEEINQKIEEWEMEEVDFIFFSASVQIWKMLFESKYPSPFTKEDNRLRKIPLDINIPNYNELLKVNRYLQAGFLKMYEEEKAEMLLRQIH